MPVEVRYLVAERPSRDVHADADDFGVDDTACLVVLHDAGTKDEQIVAVYAPGAWISGRMITDAGTS